MRTIPRNLPRPVAAGERRVVCDLCGITWMRSSCVRGRDGFLRCPDDQDGMDYVELSESYATGLVSGNSRALPGDW